MKNYFFPFIGPGSGVFLPFGCGDEENLPDLLSLTCFGSELLFTVVFVFLSVAIKDYQKKLIYK